MKRLNLALPLLFVLTTTLLDCNGADDAPSIPAPSNFSFNAVTGGTFVTLTWPAVNHATTYTVKKGTQTGTYTTIISNLANLTYVDAGLTAGTTYYYMVSASNDGGSTDASQEIAVTAGNYFNQNWVDKNGNIYIADTDDNAIEMVPAVSGTYFNMNMTAGNIYTIATGVINPLGVSSDFSGNVYIGDYGNSLFKKVDVKTGVVTVFAGSTSAPSWDGTPQPATSVSLNGTYTVTVDPYGNFFLTGAGYIAEVDHLTGKISLVAGNFAQSNSTDTMSSVCWPGSLSVKFSGEIYFTDFCNDASEVNMISADRSTMTVVAGIGGVGGGWGYSGDRGLANLSKASAASGISIDEAGNIFIADDQNNAIRKVSSGMITTYISQTGLDSTGANVSIVAAQTNNPNVVQVDYLGNIFIAQTGSSCIQKVDAGGNVTTVAGVCGTPSAQTPPANGTSAPAANLNTPFNIFLTLD